MTLLCNLAILAPTHAIKGAMKAVPSEDASPEIERLQIEMLRQMPPERKLDVVGEMSRAMRELRWPGCASVAPTTLLHGFAAALLIRSLRRNR